MTRGGYPAGMGTCCCMFGVLRGLRKLFSRMFPEPQGPGQFHHGLQDLENFLLFC